MAKELLSVFLPLKTEEVGASERSINAYQTTRRYITEDIMHVAKVIHTDVKLLFLATHEIFATLTNVSRKRFTS